MENQFKVGDVVVGPSINDTKVRTWKILIMNHPYAYAQNVKAKNDFRHLIMLTDVKLKGGVQ